MNESPDLPAGATVNPDGSVTLAVSCRLPVPRDHPDGSGIDGHQLIFRRLTGADYRKIVRAKNKLAAALHRSLGWASGDVSRLEQDLDSTDLVAVFAVVGYLLLGAGSVPDRAVPQLGGGFVLPLLYPFSDGRTAYHSLCFRPLTVEQSLACGAPERDGFMANCLSRSTGLPLWSASSVVDRMDAADFAAAQAILATLMERASEIAQARLRGRGV